MSVTKREKMSLGQWALIRTIRTSWCQESEQMCERGWRTLPYSAFHRKMLSKRRDSCQYLCEETWVGPIPRPATKNSWETLYSIHNNSKNNTLGVGGGHFHGNEMCFNTDPSLWALGATSLGAVVKGRPQALAPRLHCVSLGLWEPQLGGSQVLNGQAGHTKLVKIAASFIYDAVYEQQVMTCWMFYLFGSLLAKSQAQGPTYRAARPPVNPVGRKLPALLKWNWTVPCVKGHSLPHGGLWTPLWGTCLHLCCLCRCSLFSASTR